MIPFAMVGGRGMLLDPGDSLKLHLGLYEPRLVQAARDYIQIGDTVLDLGAHIGYYTLALAEMVGASGHVIAFEPSPANFNLLKRNVGFNGFHNVEMVNKAVMGEPGDVTLYLSDINSGMNHSREAYQTDCSQSIQVSGVMLDDYLGHDLSKISFIKMDMEGAEFAALQGMTRLLEENHKIFILTEFMPAYLTEVGIDPMEFVAFFESRGFRVSDAFEHCKVADLMKEYTVEKRNWTNLYCVRGG